MASFGWFNVHVALYCYFYCAADSIQQLQGAVTQYDKEIDKLKTDGEELQEKNRSLQAALDNSYKSV